MNLRQLLHAVRARYRLFVLVLAVTVASAAAVSLLLPKTYKATASLLVDSRDEQSLSGNGQGPLFSLPQERLSYLQTQADILGSRRVARRVVDDLHLADDPAARAAFAKLGTTDDTIEDWIAGNLLQSLKVETTQSNVIQATFTAKGPRDAAKIANGFAKAYMATVLDLRVRPAREAAIWFEEQLQRLQADVETAKAKLTEYVQRERIIAGDERSDVDHARLATLSDEAIRARDQASQLAAREQQTRRRLEQGESAANAPGIADNALLQRLLGELAAGEAKLDELATQYGPNYPLYQRQETLNRNLRERIAAETKRTADGIASTARQSRAREAGVASALAAERARLLAQREKRDAVALLKQNVESAEKAYDAALQRARAIDVDSRARGTNVALLSAAPTPLRPVSPRITLNVMLALVVGTLLGAGIVVLAEHADRRVRSGDDLRVETWEVPVLGVLGEWRPARPALLLAASGRGRRALPALDTVGHREQGR